MILSALIYFFASLTCTLVIFIFFVKSKITLGLVAPPNEEVVTHTKPIPLIGGVVIFLACYLLLFGFSFYIEVDLGYYFIGITPILVLGLFKDKIQKPVSPFFQFFVQSVSSYFLYRHWLSISMMDFQWLWFLIFMMLFNLLINAFNFLDVSDGLAGGYSTILFLVLAAISVDILQFDILFIALLFLGANIAFLIFNWYPAKVFLGDTGSFGLIYTLLFLATSRFSLQHHHSVALLLILFFVPLAEFLFTISRRISKGKLPYQGDDNHASLVLLNKGWKSSHIALLYMSATALSCFVVFILVRS